MDTVEVAVRVDRPFAERSRAAPEERMRYEAFLGLLSPAKSQADIGVAVTLFTAPPAERQRSLVDAFEKMGREAEEAGVTPEDVEEEVAAWRRERLARSG